MGIKKDSAVSAAIKARASSIELDQAAYGVSRRRISDRIRHPGLYYQRVLRDVEFLYSLELSHLAEARRAYLKTVGMFLGISLPPFTFGDGLSIPHYGSVVVNDKVRGGKFCRIHSGVNIGETRDGAPQLGSGVYIGPGAVLYGAIKIGDNSVIGANSVVNIDVPANSMAVGSPARIVRVDDAPRVMPEWIDQMIHRTGGQGDLLGSSTSVGQPER